MASLATHNTKRDWRIASPLFAVWLVLFAFGILVFKPWDPAVPLRNDFASFWTGAILVREGAGASLYDRRVQTDYQVGLRLAATGGEEIAPGERLAPVLSPPLQGLLLVPLTFLPLNVAYLVFSAGSLLAILVAVALPLRGCPWGATAAVLMLSFAAVNDTLVFGEVNAQFVLALSLGMLALSSGRSFLAGLALGLLFLKPQYALLLPVVFVLKRRWMELAGMTVAGIVLAATTLAVVGEDGIMRYVSTLREISTFHAPNGFFLYPESMANWRAVLLHLWPALSESSGYAAMTLLNAMTLSVSLLAWRGPWVPSSPGLARQMLALVIATVIASPHSNFHGLVLLLPPVAFLLSHASPNPPYERAWRWIVAGTFLAALAIWPFKVYSWLLVPFLLAGLVVLIVQCQAGRREPSSLPDLVAGR